MADEPISIRSYRVCFDLERRIHQVDRWRIPVPYGIPLRGIAYALLALAVVLVLQGLPLIGGLIAAVHPALRLVIVPVAIAYAACRLTVDGRPAHKAALAWLSYQCGPRRVAAFRPVAPAGPVALADIPFAPDEAGARYRRGVVRGPAEVVLRYPATASRRGRTLRITQADGRAMWGGKRIALGAGQRLVVR